MLNLDAKRWRDFYAVDVRYKVSVDERNNERRERRKAEYQRIVDSGYKVPHYFYHWNDAPEAEKAQLKQQAEELAQLIERASNVPLTVSEGTLL